MNFSYLLGEVTVLLEIVKIEVRFIDSDLESQDEFDSLIDYTVSNLSNLYGEEVEFKTLKRIEDNYRVGVSLECSNERFQSIVWRLRKVLRRQNFDFKVTMSWSHLKVEIENDEFIDLSCLADAAEKGILFMPGREYMAEATIYGLTHLTITSSVNEHLSFLQRILKISPDETNWMRTKSIGGYETLEDRQKYFDEVLLSEVSRLQFYEESGSYLVKDFWPPLQELAINLGLCVSTSKKKYEEKIDEVRSDLEARKQEEKIKAKHERKVEEQRKRLKEYSLALWDIFQENLFPNAFEQGRIEQLRKFLNISYEKALQVEEEIRSEIYGPNKSSFGLDYSRLRYLLYVKRWEEADEETERVILSGFSEDCQPINEHLVQQIGFVDLNTIDELWRRYSNQKFGFRKQLEIFKSLMDVYVDDSRIFAAFKNELNWVEQRSRFLQLFPKKRSYGSLDFSDNAFLGHLPTWRWCCSALHSDYDIKDFLLEAILAHLEKVLESPPQLTKTNDDSTL